MGSVAAYDVFVSYAQSDGAGAAELNHWLRAQGLRTFFDRSELKPGLRWISALEDAIGHSNAVIILVGARGFGNFQQYERELALARQTRDQAFPVIPVLMPGCQSPLTGFLQLLTWVDLSRGDSVLQQTKTLEILREALERQTVSGSPIRSLVCPYKGLEPFREEDAAFFCGRDEAIRELVGQVQKHSFVAVLGPSGTGKSSLVFAGLLPELRQQRQTTMWDVVSFRPGESPLRALAHAFGATPENAGPAAIDSYLEGEAAAYRTGDPDKLFRIVNDRLNAAPEKPDRLLIYVDQWEELYAMAPRPEEKNRFRQHAEDVEKFIALLLAAASRPHSRTSVVITARADFYAPLIRNPLLSALLPRQQVNIPPMSESDLRSAIETPARKAQLFFAPPALVDQILNDVGRQEGRLPLLQFALKETWAQRTGDQLTAEAYTAVGGVTGAIQKTAQDAYNRLNPNQQEAARRLFLRLVTPGEGQEDTRARSLIPDDPQQREIIDLFANPKTRLLVTDRAALKTEGATGATVEVAHEALIRRWSTLRAWVDGNREKLRARTSILRAKTEWEEHSQHEGYLLDPGVQLERARALIKAPGDVAIDDIRVYIQRSIDKEERGKRRTQILRIGTGLVLATVALVAVVAAWSSQEAKKLAEQRLNLARDTLKVQVKAVTEDLQNDVGIQKETLIHLLDRTASSFERLLLPLKEDAGFGRDRAEMLGAYGVAYVAQGKIPVAERKFKESLEQFQDLLKKSPDNREWRRGVAEELDQLGQIHMKEKKSDVARREYDESLQLREAIAKDASDDWRTFRDLASSQYDLGEYFMSISQPQIARNWLVEAQNNTEKALGQVNNDAGGVKELKRRKARVLVSLSEVYGAFKQKQQEKEQQVALNEEQKVALGEALEIRKELYASNPKDREIKRDLSWTYHFLGVLAYDGEDFASSERYYKESLKLRHEASVSDPSDLSAKSDLAWSELNHGNVLLRLNRPEDAREQLTMASDLMREVAFQDKANLVRRKDFCMAQMSLGDLEMDLLKPNEALVYYEEATQMLENLIKDAPTYRMHLINVYRKNGAAFLLAGDLRAATEAFDKALQLRNASYSKQHDEVEFQTELAQAHCSLGKLQKKRNEVSSARGSYGKCQELARALLARDEKPPSADHLLDEATNALQGLPDRGVN
jgi:tetratricopeptide (TPR) repeat protein